MPSPFSQTIRRIIITALIVFLGSFLLFTFYFKQDFRFSFSSQNQPPRPIFPDENEPKESVTSDNPTESTTQGTNDAVENTPEEETEEPIDLPTKFQNKAPFVPQAPYANWDAIHEEACEEASLIMAHYYLKQEAITKEKAEEEIQAMVSWQMENYSGHHDLNVEKMTELANRFYGDNLTIKKDPQVEDLKRWLAQKRLIVVPAAGRVLLNPYFKQPGPIYHVLVLTGYDSKKEEFIANDPGTKRGQDFRYPFANLMDSLHDFPGDKKKILLGEKKVMITEPGL